MLSSSLTTIAPYSVFDSLIEMDQSRHKYATDLSKNFMFCRNASGGDDRRGWTSQDLKKKSEDLSRRAEELRAESLRVGDETMTQLAALEKNKAEAKSASPSDAIVYAHIIGHQKALSEKGMNEASMHARRHFTAKAGSDYLAYLADDSGAGVSPFSSHGDRGGREENSDRGASAMHPNGRK